ncbi:MAG: ribonucleoside-diphosphate reductase subunit alpha [Xenococcaceae cyanobacterium]
MQQSLLSKTAASSNHAPHAPKDQRVLSSGKTPEPGTEKNIQVIRRDGSKTSLDIAKIRSVVHWACAGFDVNPIALEAGLTTRLRNGITTREIQDNLINCALEMCSPSDPDWRYVAGRLHIWSLWKDTLVSRGYQYSDYEKTVRSKVESNQYDRRILTYSADELLEAGSWINPDWDTDYDYAGAILLTSRYLLPDELPQEALLTCALLLASIEVPEERMVWARRFYEAIATRKISLATPILANLRIPGGSLTSCFPAGAPVMTKEGFKPIETIDIGDVVLTHENRFRTVMATNQRKFEGNLVTIKVDGLESVVTSTEDHLFMVIPQKEAVCQRLKANQSYLTNQGKRKRYFIPGQYEQVACAFEKAFSPEWVRAEYIRPGDWMQIPFNSDVRNIDELFLTDFITDSDVDVIDGRVVRLNADISVNEQLNQPLAKIPVNKAFMLLLGYYLAEGYSSTDTNIVSLNFNSKGSQYIEESCAIFESVFGIKPKVEREKDNSSCVKLHSKWVAQFFHNFVGTGFNSKALPPEIMLASPSLQRHLLKGVFRGDGSVDQNSLRLTLCNKVLIDQLFEICLRCGLTPSISKAKKGKSGKEIYDNLFLSLDKNADFEGFVSGVWSDGKFYRKVSKIQIKSLNKGQTVYDLQVAEDSSFCVGRMAAHNCFITSIDDNLESIFEEITNTARISKNGGGVGVNVSRIRSTGSWVMGKANASGGVIPWIKLLNDTAIAVNQGGRRAGAVTVSLDIWHLDVPEFLEMQAENGDQRRKAYDIFPQLVITDEFMRRVVDEKEWTLVDPYEVRRKLGIELAELWGEEFEQWYEILEERLGKEITLYKKVSARELFKKIMRSQLETGMPYLAFKDTINRANPNKHEGYIPGVNLCTESFSNVEPGKFSHCCNLASLNLATIEDDELLQICSDAVRILDNTIELTHPPFQEAKNHNQRYRTIGVGAMGLADWLAKRYFSCDAISEISSLFEKIAYHCTHTSMELAKERGAYPAFPESEWSKGKLLGAKDLDFFREKSDEPTRWEKLSEEIKQHGIRNSHITAIAPNTSSSLVQGCTASVLPVYSRFFYDKWAKGTVPIAPPFISDRFWFYQENKTLDQKKVVKAVATIQQWIDTGISMELMFNLNQGVYFPEEPERSLKAKDIFEILVMAWQEGCKAIYYIRTCQKDSFEESSDCASCAN